MYLIIGLSVGGSLLVTILGLVLGFCLLNKKIKAQNNSKSSEAASEDSLETVFIKDAPSSSINE
jgi:hypothetical protein